MKITTLPSILIGALTLICNINASPVNSKPNWIGTVELTDSDLKLFYETFTPEVLVLDTKNAISKEGTTAIIYPVKKFTKSRTGKPSGQLVAKVFNSESDMNEISQEAKALNGIKELEGTGRIKLPGEKQSRVVIIELKKDGKTLLDDTELQKWYDNDDFMNKLKDGYCEEVARIAKEYRFLHYDGNSRNALFTFKTPQKRTLVNSRMPDSEMPVLESVSIVDWGAVRWVQEPLPTEDEVKNWCLKFGVYFQPTLGY